MKILGTRAMAALTLAALGCAIDAPTTGNENPATGAHPEETGMKLLFEDHYSDTGVIHVYEANPGVAVQVSGAIGVDDPVAMGEILALDNLESVYLALHRDAQRAPDALLAIDRRIAADKAAVLDRVLARARAQGSMSPPLTEKTLDQFKSTVCKTFSSWSDKYTPAPCPSCIYTESNVALDCDYHDNTHATCQYTGGMYSGDRAYGWNQSNYWATVWQRDLHNVTHGGTLRLPPWYWNWVSWSYSNNYNACLELDGSSSLGSLGITFHQWTPIVH